VHFAFGQLKHVPPVMNIHNEYPVEPLKIIRLELSGPLVGDVNTVFSPYLYGASVG
jgi:hypothetical protein